MGPVLCCAFCRLAVTCAFVDMRLSLEIEMPDTRWSAVRLLRTSIRGRVKRFGVKCFGMREIRSVTGFSPWLQKPVRRPACRPYVLAFPLALRHLFYFVLVRPACHSGCPLCLRSGLLPRGALQALAFYFVFHVLCVHSSILIPAYFAIIFFNPYPGKLIVSFASSPSPSRRNTVPRPYFGC